MSTDFEPPRTKIDLALTAAGLDEILTWPNFDHVSREDVNDAVEGFGRLASNVIAPTNRIGDLDGVQFDAASATVTTPEPIRAAFAKYVEGGWVGFTAPMEYGGSRFPALAGAAIEEILVASNLALSLNPMLTHGAIHLLEHWGTEEQRLRYLPSLVSGRWTGTMMLTEPEAGSDLRAVRTKAVPRPDGQWEISGTKIFITWGEHDLAENIIHMVLARTPGAPSGTKGTSLFAVSRRLLGTRGEPLGPNAMRCIGIENKLGIHASPTCVMELDGAIGEMVGPEHGGMSAMFTMMNTARRSIGVQGLAVAERAYQQALSYAQTRRQGQAASPCDSAPALIICHADVRRMLLTMASGIDAMRVLLYTTASAADRAMHHPDATVRASAQARVDLLTPIAKAWCADEGVRLTSTAIQIHGGMGYIEETGVAQHWRDSRIAPIYEGTNGIQAIDLVVRKVQRDGGAAMFLLLDELREIVWDAAGTSNLKNGADRVLGALDALFEATRQVVASDRSNALGAASPYLELAALGTAGALLARQASWAQQYRSSAEADAFTGRFCFFAGERTSQATALLHAVEEPAERLCEAFLY